MHVVAILLLVDPWKHEMGAPVVSRRLHFFIVVVHAFCLVSAAQAALEVPALCGKPKTHE